MAYEFKNSAISEMVPISDWFWNIIAKAAKDQSQLCDILEELTQDELRQFIDDFNEAAVQLKDEPYLQYVMDEASEDTWDDITHWVVSQGKEYYEQVWNNPQLMPAYIAVDNEENLHGIAEALYYERLDKIED